jgi:hypothetical protein
MISVLEHIRREFGSPSAESRGLKDLDEEFDRLLLANQELDQKLLMNSDRKTFKVSFDQNRQLLRGFSQVLKNYNNPKGNEDQPKSVSCS